jgi:hypothetical protein
MSERYNKPGCFVTVTPLIVLLWIASWMVL